MKIVDIALKTGVYIILYFGSYQISSAHNFSVPDQSKFLVPEIIFGRYTSSSAVEFQDFLSDFALGDSLFITGNLTEATNFYRLAHQKAKKLKDPWMSIICLNRLGFTNYWQRKYEESGKFYKESLLEIDKSHEIRDSLAWFEALVLYRNCDYILLRKETETYDSKIADLQLSEKLPLNGIRKVKYYLLDVMLAFSQSDFFRIEKSANRAAQLIKDHSFHSAGLWQFFIRYYLAEYCINMEDYELALHYFDQLEQQAVNDKNFMPYAFQMYFSKFKTYLYYGHFEKAEAYIEKILPLISDEKHAYYSITYLQMGYVLQYLGKSNLAMTYYRKSESLLSCSSITDDRLALVYWYIASFHQWIDHNPAMALPYLLEAHKILEKHSNPYLKTFITRDIGACYLEIDPAKSIAYIDPLLTDLDSLLSDNEYFETQYHSLTNSLYRENIEYRARAYVILARKNNNDSLMLRKAYLEYRKLVDLALKLFEKREYEDSKIYALSNIRDAYKYAFTAGKRLYDLTGNRNLLNELFNYSENSKAFLLKNYLSDETMKKMAGVSEEDILRARKLRKQLDTLQYTIGPGHKITSDLRQELLIDKIVLKSREIETYDQVLQESYPKYAKLKSSKKSTTVEQVQDILDPSQVFLEYFLSQRYLYIFCINREMVKLFQIDLNEGFPDQITEFRRYFENFSYEYYNADRIKEFARQSFALYSIIIAPVEEFIAGKRLLIVTDQELGYIPFETLITIDPDSLFSSRYNELPFLLLKNPISYLYSSSQLKKDRQVKGIYRYAGFAPDYTSANLSRSAYPVLKSLPGARDEVMIGNKYYTGRTFTGENGNKEAFLKEINRSDIVHLAMHALPDSVEARNSLLLFSPDIQKEEMQLHSFEVYTNPAHAALIILSACNTGSGKLNSGEGIFSIARSFLLAGIDNVIYTQWTIPDRSSARLMKQFYALLADNKPVDIALQEAKINILTKGDPVNAHPYFWAGYMNMGDPVSLPANRIMLRIVVPASCLFIVALIYLIIRRRIRASASLR